MFTPQLPYSQSRASPSPGGQGDAEHVVRERMRGTRMRPDGSVESVVEAERLSIWGRPSATALTGGSLIPTGWWAQFCELLWFLAGAHIVIGTAILGGALAHAVGGSAVLGYLGVWCLVWFIFVRQR